MRRSSILLLSCLLAPAAVAADQDALRVVSPDPGMQWTAESLANFDARWLHLKFVEGLDVRLVPAQTESGLALREEGGVDITTVNVLIREAATLRSTFPGDRERFRRWKEIGELASGAAGPDLSLWFDVEIEGGHAALADLINALNALAVVEVAHGAPTCEPAVILSRAPTALRPAFFAPFMTPIFTPEFTKQQTYLFATPTGLDAPSAWARTGGRGAGMKFIDVELGWIHAHEDFDASRLFHNNGNNDPNSGYRDHGTAVVGEVVGVGDNVLGITGFADDAQWGTVGILIGEWPNVPHRFLEAAQALDAGDAWLIELQMYPSGRSATPMEWLQVNYDVIWTSSWSMNVVCVEAGANGSQNLDDASWGGVFDRNVRDSGAIMVGAGTPTGRVAESFTNYGSRMDAHAWGSSIVTTGYGDLYTEGSVTTEYTAGFGGTSGASPMVTGSALCLQGIARQTLGHVLTPAELRQLITETGIPNLGQKYIGPRPDLGAAVEAIDDMVGTQITSVSVVRGTLISGGLADLLNSDNAYVRVRSAPGFTAQEANLLEIRIGAETTNLAASTLDISVEGRLNNPGGTSRWRLRNWSSNQFEQVHQHSLGTTESTEELNGIAAANRIRQADGRIDLSIRQFMVATFTAQGFDSFTDHVVIAPQ